MTRVYCDSCGHSIVDSELSAEQLKICRSASAIMEAADYSIDIDVCPECAKWLYEKVGELIDNKFHFNKEERENG